MPPDLDPQAYNLARAIRRTETGGSKDPYNAKGGSGEYGAYQFMPATWKSWAGKYLGNPNAPLTIENQNKVAYSRIKERKDAGLSPAQIASEWNSGGADKYRTQGAGVNKYGVAHDVAGYTAKVSAAYNELRGSTPTTPQQPTPVQPVQPKTTARPGSLLNRSVNPNTGREIVGGQKGFIPEIAGIVPEVIDTFRGAFGKEGKVTQALQNPNIGGPSKALQVWGNTVGAVGNATGDVVMGLLESIAPEGVERVATRGVQKGAQAIASTAPVQKLMGEYQEFKQRDPEGAANLEATLAGLSGSVDLLTLGAGSLLKSPATQALKGVVKESVERTLVQAGKQTLKSLADDTIAPTLKEVARKGQWEALGSMQKRLIRKGMAGDDVVNHFLPEIEKEAVDKASGNMARYVNKIVNQTMSKKTKTDIETLGRTVMGDQFRPGIDDEKALQEVFKRVDIFDTNVVDGAGRLQTRNIALNAEKLANDKIYKSIVRILDGTNESLPADRLDGIVDSVVNGMMSRGVKFGEGARDIGYQVRQSIMKDLKSMGYKFDDAGNMLPGQRIKLKDTFKKFNDYESDDVKDEAIKKVYREATKQFSDATTSKHVDDLMKEYGIYKDAARIMKGLSGKSISSFGTAKTLGILGGMGAAGFSYNPLLYMAGNFATRTIFKKYKNMMARRLLTSSKLENYIKDMNSILDDSVEATLKRQGDLTTTVKKSAARKSGIVQRRAEKQATQARADMSAKKRAVAEYNDLKSLEDSYGQPLEKIPEDIIQREIQEAEDSLAVLKEVKPQLRKDAKLNSDAKKELESLLSEEKQIKEGIRSFRKLIKNRGMVEVDNNVDLTPDDMQVLDSAAEGIQY